MNNIAFKKLGNETFLKLTQTTWSNVESLICINTKNITNVQKSSVTKEITIEYSAGSRHTSAWVKSNNPSYNDVNKWFFE